MCFVITDFIVFVSKHMFSVCEDFFFYFHGFFVKFCQNELKKKQYIYQIRLFNFCTYLVEFRTLPAMWYGSFNGSYG